MIWHCGRPFTLRFEPGDGQFECAGCRKSKSPAGRIEWFAVPARPSPQFRLYRKIPREPETGKRFCTAPPLSALRAQGMQGALAPVRSVAANSRQIAERAQPLCCRLKPTILPA